MKRFNLLLVTHDQSLRPIALKALGKVFQSNFVFELPTLAEAEKILQKLHIDVLLLDFDTVEADLVALNRRFPAMRIIGLATSQHLVRSNIDAMRHQILEKRDFAQSFAVEIKAQKKELEKPERIQLRTKPQAPASPTDFVDFVALTKSK